MGSPPSEVRPAFVFDADFPQGTIQQLLEDWIPSVELVPWELVIPTVTGVSDEDFIIHAWQRGLQGVVSCNFRMLSVPETLAIIRQTKMSVVTCHAQTNKVQAATGVLLLNLGNIARSYNPSRPQVWDLKYPMRSPLKLRTQIEKVERRTKTDIAAYERSDAELTRPLFPHLP